jgi:phosphoribosyl 1,2-cyclic phosphate phosphodiesterase
MEITVLGSGGVLGVPVWSCDCKVCRKARKDKRNRRTRPSILVRSEGKTILVDMGPDFRIQMLERGIRKLDTVLITHAHGDHSACISELRAGGKVSLEIPAPVFEVLRKKSELFEYIKSRNPALELKKFKPHKIGRVFVNSIRVKHEKDYSKKPVPCYGFLFEEKGFRFAYIPDYSEILEPEKVRNLDLLIADGATFESKWGHAGIKGGVEVYKKIMPKRMLFTHVGHSSPQKELKKFVERYGNIGVAYDGMVIKN